MKQAGLETVPDSESEIRIESTDNQHIVEPVGNRITIWNYENQPTQYRLPTGLPVTMAYNGDNRRISLVQGTSTTKFVWDPVIDAYIQELDGSNVLIASYTNEPQQYGGVLSQRRGSTSSFLHADALGTTRLLTSTAGATTDTYLLDAWGNPVSSTGSTVNPFRWVGRYGYYTDSITGLIYVRARMYMPTLARWCSIDPRFPEHVQRAFEYGMSIPVMQVDPSGEDVFVTGIEGTGAFVGMSDKDINDSYFPIVQRIIPTGSHTLSVPQVIVTASLVGGVPIPFVGSAEKIKLYAQDLKANLEAEDPSCKCCYPRSVLIGFSYGALTVIKVLEELKNISEAKVDLVFLIDVVANNPWKAGKAVVINANNYCRLVNVWQTSAAGLIGFHGNEVAGADINRHFTGPEVDAGPFNPNVGARQRTIFRRHPNLPKLTVIQDMFEREMRQTLQYGLAKARPSTCGVDDICGQCPI